MRYCKLFRDCKDPDISVLDAVLNLVEHHAETIKEQQNEIIKLHEVIADAVEHFKTVLTQAGVC